MGGGTTPLLRRSLKAILAVALCACLLGAGLATSSAPAARPFAPLAAVDSSANPVSVVVVVLDELPVVSLLDRSGDIDDRLYPNFAALRDESIWFRNATTVAELTSAVLPAIFTGIRPTELALNIGGRAPQSLFTLLSPTHEVSTSRSFSTLCDLDVCARAKRADPPAALPLAGFGREPRGQRLVSYLDRLPEAERPCLCVLHLVMPHSPWDYLPSGRSYPSTDPMPGQIPAPGPGRKWVGDQWLVRLARARHLLQVGFADRLLGVIRRDLAANDLYDDALVVVVADHGVSFRAGARKRAATPVTLGDVAYVPLFVKLPHQSAASIVEDPVEVIDVVPTILDVTDVQPPIPLDGTSLFEPLEDRARRVGGEYLDPDAAERDHAVERKFNDFGALRGWDDVVGISPKGGARWVGRQAPRVPLDPGLEATMPAAAAVETASAGDLDVPSLLSGVVRGPAAKEGHLLLVAVDGIVVAATRTYRGPRGTEFYALVPPRTYVDPPHRLQLFRAGPGASVAEIRLGPGS